MCGLRLWIDRLRDIKRLYVLIYVLLCFRWEKIVSRIAERGRLLDQALKEAKGFNDNWTDLCQWLDNSDQLLDDSQVATNDPEKIKTQIIKHKVFVSQTINKFSICTLLDKCVTNVALPQEFQRVLGSKQPSYDSLMKQGRDLVVKSSDDSDTQTIGAMLTSLKSKWTSVCGKSVDR